MSVRYSNVDKNYSLAGRFASATAFLSARNDSSATEGDIYYDTTLNQLRTYDGTNWSPAGISSQSAGSLNDAASIGSTITIDGSTVTADFAVTVDDGSNDVVATFTQNEITNNNKCLLLVNTGTGVTLDFTSSGTYDIQGTSDLWDISAAGASHFTAVAVDDDEDIELGAATNGDVRMLFHDGAVGTAANGLLIDALGSDEQIQIGDATYTFDVWFVGETATTNFMKWDFDAGENSVGALVFDNADIHLGDNDRVQFGDTAGGDFSFDYNGSDLLIVPASNNDGILFGSATAATDITIYGDTATSNLQWYSTGDRLVFLSAASSSDVMLQLDDYVQMTFGTGASGFGTTGSGDVRFEFDSANFNMTAAAADTPWAIGGTAAGFDVTYYHESVGTIFVDYDGLETAFDGCDLRLKDNDYLLLGDSATAGGTTDGTIRWDATNGVLEVVGATNFEQDAAFANVTISGTFTHSGAYSPTSLALGDNEPLNCGDGTDVVIDYDSATSDLHINGGAANQGIDFGAATTVDVRLTGANYDAQWDASRDHLLFQDNAVCAFGGTNDSASDYKISTAGSTGYLVVTAVAANDCVSIGDGTVATDFRIDNITTAGADIWFDQSADTAAGTLYVGTDGKGIDTKFFGESSSSYLMWDMSADMLLVEAADIALGDGDKILFGDALGTGDLVISSTSAVLNIGQVAGGTGTITIGADGTGIDTKFFGDTAGDYMLWDQNLATNGGLYFLDTCIRLDDATSYWDFGPVASNVLPIEAKTANETIKFGSTTNFDIGIYGATNTNYVQFDTDDSALNVILDGFKITFQDASTSMVIGPNASNVLPIEGGAANDTIQIGNTTNVDVGIYGATNTNSVLFDTDDSALDIILTNFAIVYNDTNVDYTLAESSDALSLVATDHASAALTIGSVVTTNGLDLIWQSHTSGDKVEFNGGSDNCTFTDIPLVFSDGTSTFTIGKPASNILPIEGNTANDTIKIGATTNLDVGIYGQTATNYVLYNTDDSALDVDLVNFALRFLDGTSTITFGPVASNSIPLGSGTDDDELVIGNGSQRFDFRIDNAGQAGADITFDASGDTNAGTWGFGVDNLGVDVYFRGATTNKEVFWDQSADSWHFGKNDEGIDVTFHGDTAGIDLLWDASADGLLVKDTTKLAFGNTIASPDVLFAPDGTNLDVTVGGSAVVTIGDGGTTNYTKIDSTGDITQTGSAQLTSFRLNVIAKTGAYSVTAAESGTIFTNTGAGGAVNFTLPSNVTGLCYYFVATADQNIRVTADTADTMVIFNDAAADYIEYSTASQKIGGGFWVFADGSKWIALPLHYDSAAIAQTITTST